MFYARLALPFCICPIDSRAFPARQIPHSSWDAERVFAPDQVLEVRWVSGRLHVARKERHHDEWDRPVEAYDPYGPRVVVLNDVMGLQEPVTHHSDDVTEA